MRKHCAIITFENRILWLWIFLCACRMAEGECMDESTQTDRKDKPGTAPATDEPDNDDEVKSTVSTDTYDL